MILLMWNYRDFVTIFLGNVPQDWTCRPRGHKRSDQRRQKGMKKMVVLVLVLLVVMMMMMMMTTFCCPNSCFAVFQGKFCSTALVVRCWSRMCHFGLLDPEKCVWVETIEVMMSRWFRLPRFAAYTFSRSIQSPEGRVRGENEFNPQFWREFSWKFMWLKKNKVSCSRIRIAWK